MRKSAARSAPTLLFQVRDWAIQNVRLSEENANRLVEQKINGESLVRLTVEQLKAIGFLLGMQ